MASKRGFLKLLSGHSKKSVVLVMVNSKAAGSQDLGAAAKENAPARPATKGNKEFSIIASAGKLLRSAAECLTNGIIDKTVVNRMMKVLFVILKDAQVNTAGVRDITTGPLELFRNFNFNYQSSLKHIVYRQIKTVINRQDGLVKVDVESITPAYDFQITYGATHFQFLSTVCEIDFTNGTFKSDLKQTGIIPLQNIDNIGEINHLHSVSENCLLPIFIIGALKFYTQDHGQMRPIIKSDKIPVSILDVDHV